MNINHPQYGFKVQSPFSDEVPGNDPPFKRIAAPTHTEPVRETVLLVHGTWANVASGAPAWSQAGSDFCSRMNHALENSGCVARCWADVGLVLTDLLRHSSIATANGNSPPFSAW
jgi:hypothetical protein